MIEGFFTRWYATWAFAIGGDKGRFAPQPPDSRLIGDRKHTPLRRDIGNAWQTIYLQQCDQSPYSSNSREAILPLRQPLIRSKRNASSSSRGKPLEIHAQQHRDYDACLPQIQFPDLLTNARSRSFAAMICFRLSTMGSTSNQRLAPSIRILIEETADVLERIGTIPPHRKGISAIYGRHLRNVIGGTKDTLRGEQAITMPPRNQIVPKQPEGHVLEPIQFSAMSDDQIVQTINNSGEEFGNHSLGFQIDERSELDWLDWFNMDVTT
jgi:hypothetical protein